MLNDYVEIVKKAFHLLYVNMDFNLLNLMAMKCS